MDAAGRRAHATDPVAPSPDYSWIVGGERGLLPLLHELGYARLLTSRASGIEGATNPASQCGHRRAAVGALHGRSALPQRRVEGLLGCTAESDDGRVFELIEQARQRWWG